MERERNKDKGKGKLEDRKRDVEKIWVWVERVDIRKEENAKNQQNRREGLVRGKGGCEKAEEGKERNEEVKGYMRRREKKVESEREEEKIIH